jgi:hypothetical protein
VRIEALAEILTFMRAMSEEDQEAFIRLQNSMDENGKYIYYLPNASIDRIDNTDSSGLPNLE